MISIVIPAKNEEKRIESTLKSVREQDFEDYELIVVVNGSEDKTYEVAKDYADVVLELDKGNVSYARNGGAALASGELLVFLDADTVLSKNALSVIADSFTKRDAFGTLKVKPDDKRVGFVLAMGVKNFYHKFHLNRGGGGIFITWKEYWRKEKFDESKSFLEIRDFGARLKKFGGYKYMNKAFVVTSMRRFREKGVLGNPLFFVKEFLREKLHV